MTDKHRTGDDTIQRTSTSTRELMFGDRGWVARTTTAILSLVITILLSVGLIYINAVNGTQAAQGMSLHEIDKRQAEHEARHEEQLKNLQDTLGRIEAGVVDLRDEVREHHR